MSENRNENVVLEALINDPAISNETKLELQQRMIENLRARQKDDGAASGQHIAAEQAATKSNTAIKVLLFCPKIIGLILGYTITALAAIFYAAKGLLRVAFGFITVVFIAVFVMMIKQNNYDNLLWIGIAAGVGVMATIAAERLPYWVQSMADSLLKASRFK